MSLSDTATNEKVTLSADLSESKKGTPKRYSELPEQTWLNSQGPNLKFWETTLFPSGITYILADS